MDCCAHQQGLNKVFNADYARREVRAYLKKGIDKHARRMVEAVLAADVNGASVLEVGGGIGGLHQELLKRGAARAVGVDISAAYVSAAQSLAEKLGTRERVDYRVADFARESDSVPAADLVLLHRVVCCYPDMPALVAAAGRHTRRLMALSFPRAAWYMRLFEKLTNFAMWLTRSGFRFYLHAPEAIVAAAAAVGLRPAQHISSWPWRIVVFERAG
jgi:magnesium-protoporphyrin O-methyltransferase